MREGQGRRYVKRWGRTATLDTYTGSGAFTVDGEATTKKATKTTAVVVLRGGGSSMINKNPEGEDELLDAEVFIPDDVVVAVKGAVRRPEITVGSARYAVAEVDGQSRNGLTRLICASMRVA